MAWTQPKTWTSEPLTSSDLNTHLRDNLEALKDPPSANYELNEASNYTTTSTSFVNVDGSKLSLTINTNGGDVLVHFHGLAASAVILFDVSVDGVRDGGNDGYVRIQTIGPVSFTRLITGLAPGSHTFKLMWRVTTGTGTLYAGAGTTDHDVHPQFWAREVS